MIGHAAIAFGVVFLAELGDKTQLVALTTAARHGAARTLVVLGVMIAILQTLSVTVGAAVASVVPERLVMIGAGVLFVGFGVWTWRGATSGDDPSSATGAAPTAGPTVGLIKVAALFFVAELGDKTMLTTAGLAASRPVVAVWAGSFAAMVAATAIAVTAGGALGRRVPAPVLHHLGAASFVLVGLVTLGAAALSTP
ncbi:MAG: TMEM165/GDT1 family protein [Actinomycetota bacterium]